jgi:hypothetical protein
VGGLLAAAVLLSGAYLRAADDPAKTDQPRKEQPRADDSKKDNARGGDARRDEARADTDVQKQLDQMKRDMEEMRRFMDQLRRAMPGTFGGAGGAAGGFAGGPGGQPGFPGAGRFGPQPHLGVVVRPADPTLAEQLGLKQDQGLVVERVMPDSPADKAGIKPHDILVEVNGKSVPDDAGQLAQMLGDIKSDNGVDVTLIRKGKSETLKGIKLQSGPAEGRPRGPRDPERQPDRDRDRDRNR